MFTPGESARQRHEEVAEVILVLVIGMGHRAVAHSMFGTLSAPVRATILREIDALACTWHRVDRATQPA